MKKIIIDQNLLDDLGESNTIFKRSGITFFPARSSEEILNLHGVKRADLIITDAALPVMGGAEALLQDTGRCRAEVCIDHRRR